jgi:hypothetical protein
MTNAFGRGRGIIILCCLILFEEGEGPAFHLSFEIMSCMLSEEVGLLFFADFYLFKEGEGAAFHLAVEGTS